MKYFFKVGEWCKFDTSLCYIDRCEIDKNGFMTPTCFIGDGMCLPKDKAQEVVNALNEILGECEVPQSQIRRVTGENQ